MPTVELKLIENTLYCITQNNENIGLITIIEYENKVAYLEDFNIYEKYRNKGFGSQVLDEIKKRFNEIILIAKPLNVEIFYIKNGFFKVGSFMVYN